VPDLLIALLRRTLPSSVAFRRFLVCTLLAGCTPSPSTSTEAGNPPVIKMQFFSWIAPKNEGFVVLVGEPGAVDEGGAKLRIKNLRTGEVTTVLTNSDGSFRIEVPGSFADGFEITASNEDATSKPFTVTGEEIVDTVKDGGMDAGDPSDARPDTTVREAASTGSDRDAGPDGSDRDAAPDGSDRDTSQVGTSLTSTLSPAECRAESANVVMMIERSTAAAGRSCTVAEDCVFLRPTLATECSPSCSTQVASIAGRESLEPIVQGIERGGCADFKAAGCKLEDPMCPPDTRTLTCANGLCIAAEPMATVSCESMTAEAEKRLMPVLASDENTCRVDADCTVVGVSPDCFDRCLAVSPRIAGALLNAIENIDQACADFEALGCQQAVDTCTEDEPHPVCTNGRCARAPIQP
jgi:hypothetical protein